LIRVFVNPHLIYYIIQAFSNSQTKKPEISLASCKKYTKSDGKCACSFYIEKRTKWKSAILKCQSYGARLPEIMSAEDNEAILSSMVSL